LRIKRKCLFLQEKLLLWRRKVSNSGDLIVKAGKWAKWLEARFNTYDPIPAADSSPATAAASAQPMVALQSVGYVPRMINGRR
jgi:hypothetical protein